MYKKLLKKKFLKMLQIQSSFKGFKCQILSIKFQISTLESFGAIKVRMSVGNKTLSKKKFDGPIHLNTTILQPSFL